MVYFVENVFPKSFGIALEVLGADWAGNLAFGGGTDEFPDFFSCGLNLKPWKPDIFYVSTKRIFFNIYNLDFF